MQRAKRDFGARASAQPLNLMKNWRSMILALMGLAMLRAQSACTINRSAVPTVDFEAMRTLPALEWIDANRNESALATNRFGPTAEARAFVVELLRLGAVNVYVADPKEGDRFVKEEGGPYADSLVVDLPLESSKRAALFAIFSREARREGYAPERDVGQSRVLLWWD